MDDKMVYPISGQAESSFVVSIVFQKLKERASPLRICLFFTESYIYFSRTPYIAPNKELENCLFN